MKKISLLAVLFYWSVQSLLAQCGTGTGILVSNPSFEGPTAPHVGPFPWNTCGITPDTQPGSWGVTQAPSDGSSYLGLVYGGSSWQEGVSQQLTDSLIAGTPYEFTIDLSAADAQGGGIDSSSHGLLEIWGSDTICTKTELLWSSPLINHIGWETYPVSFTPTDNYSHIYFLNNGEQMGYLLVDNISNLPTDTTTLQIISHQDSVIEDCSFNIWGYVNPYLNDSVVVEGAFVESPLTAMITDSVWSATVSFTSIGYQNLTATSYYTDNQGSQAICSLVDVLISIQSPDANFSAIPNCSNLPVSFTDLSAGVDTNSITTWNWTFGDGNSSSQTNPTHIYGTAGVYDVTLGVISSDGCSDDTTIQVSSLPIPETDFIFTEVCLGYTTNFHDFTIPFGGQITSWQWDFGDGNQSALPDAEHIYANADTYTVTLVATDVNGCSDSLTQNVDVFVCNSVNELDSKVSMELFPNPVSDLLTIMCPEKMNAIYLFDNAGRLIRQDSENFNEIKILNVSNLSSGNYFLKIDLEHSGMVIRKVNVFHN